MVDGFDLPGLRNATQSHGPVVRVLIAFHAGSSPRETGTSMLVWSDGQSGTIGGGTLEFEATSKARQLLQTPDAKQAVKYPLGPALGQCCGGAVTLVFEQFTSATLPGTENNVFSRPVTADTDVQPLAVTRVIRNMRNLTDPRAIAFTDGWLVENMGETQAPLWLYGAGHVGREIVSVLEGLPFEITWVDTSGDRFPAEMPANVSPLVAKDPGDVVHHAPSDAQHLVLTYSHAFDLDICHRVLSREFAMLGVIGSDTKKKRFVSRLATLGHSSDQISRMICPIGQRNLGKTPKAIAIGVAAELIAFSESRQTRKEARL